MPQLIPVAVQAAASFAVGQAISGLTAPKQRRAARVKPVDTRPPEIASAEIALGQSILPGGPQIGLLGRRRVGGRIVLEAKSGAHTYIVVCIAGAPVTSINAIYVNNTLVARDANEDVTTAAWVNGATKTMNIKLYTGAQVVTDPVLKAAFSGWDSSFIGYNQTYARIRLTPSGSVYANGTPDFAFDVSGFKVYDPRDGAQSPSTPSTWQFSENAALVCAGYLMHDLGRGLPHTDIDWSSVATAANVCDELVPLASGLSETRYTCAALWYTSETHEDVIEKIERSMAGACYLLNGKYRIDAGTFIAPTIAALTPADYAGPISFDDTPRLDAAANGVRGRFASPTNNFELRDFPAYVDTAALAEDQGRTSWLDRDYPFVTRSTQAQRLARIDYRRARNGAPCHVELRFAHFDIVRGDTVPLVDSLAGINATFRVMQDGLTGAGPYIVELSLQKEDATVFAWSTADEKNMPPAVVLTASAGGVGVNPDDTATLQPTGAIIWGSGTTSAFFLNLRVLDTPSTRATLSRATWPNSGANTVTEPSTLIQLGPINLTLGSNGSLQVGSVQIRAEFGAEVSAYNARTFTQTLTQMLSAPNNAEATTTLYIMPAAPALRINSQGSGSAILNYYTCNGGARVPNLRIYENTVNDSSTATLISTPTNADGTINVTGTVGSTKYYWARGYNASGPVQGPFSNPLLVAF